MTLDVTGVRLLQLAKDRVRVTGARGRPAPEHLKATVSHPGEWLGEAGISHAETKVLVRAELELTVLKSHR